MSDFNSSLPVRTETNGDVAVILVDGTVVSQKASVDTSGRQSNKIFGVDPAVAQQQVAVSEGGEVRINGIYNVTTNTKPSKIGLTAHVRGATPADSDLTNRLTSITNSTVHALDISLHDAAGAAFSPGNALPVVLGTVGTPVNDFLKSSALAAAATANHDYTVILTTFSGTQFNASASGKIKVEIALETAAASGVFVDFWVGFNSTANPNVVFKFDNDYPTQVTGAKVRMAITNLDKQAEDVYSTISGHEV